VFVAPPGDLPEINNIKSFIVPPKKGINYKAGVWHFPLISTEDTDFLVIDRQGSGDNLIIHSFNQGEVLLKY
jgi:ureidoglycolate lyase